MTGYLEEYFPLIVFFVLALSFGLILMLAPLVAAVTNPIQKKTQRMSVVLSPSVPDCNLTLDFIWWQFYL